jgi:hypothetical protein
LTTPLLAIAHVVLEPTPITLRQVPPPSSVVQWVMLVGAGVTVPSPPLPSGPHYQRRRRNRQYR